MAVGTGEHRIAPRRSTTHNWLETLTHSLLKSVSGLADSMIDAIEEAVIAAGRRMALRVFIFLLSILGIAFFLFGLARSLSYLFQYPGLGESIVGLLSLSIALTLFLFTKDRK